MTWTAWRDVLLIRTGPWAFEIIGLYIWLVVAAIPCLLMLHRAGWRAPLAVSWALYLWYRIDPHALTMAGFESAFPILSWQLLFIHGIAIGYHRREVGAFVARMPAHHAAGGGAHRRRFRAVRVLQSVVGRTDVAAFAPVVARQVRICVRVATSTSAIFVSAVC